MKDLREMLMDTIEDAIRPYCRYSEDAAEAAVEAANDILKHYTVMRK